ncbi:MAG TPA: hypothetical protein VIH90_07480, partial [Candidatus Saccharimonadales bacterium]
CDSPYPVVACSVPTAVPTIAPTVVPTVVPTATPTATAEPPWTTSQTGRVNEACVGYMWGMYGFTSGGPVTTMLAETPTIVVYDNAGSNKQQIGHQSYLNWGDKVTGFVNFSNPTAEPISVSLSLATAQLNDHFIVSSPMQWCPNYICQPQPPPFFTGIVQPGDQRQIDFGFIMISLPPDLFVEYAVIATAAAPGLDCVNESYWSIENSG